MTPGETVVADYGVGNLFSICRAVEKCGSRVRLVDDADEIAKADRVILPGVGAFGEGMAELKRLGLADAVIEFAKSGRPLLGICLGMQMLFDLSEEFGRHEGLRLIPGRVSSIRPARTDGQALKVPHIGWNALREPFPGRWAGTMLKGTMPGTTVYFVHSFAAKPSDRTDVMANCNYGGHEIVAAVRHENIHGCQFHPERSGPAGLKILDRFLAS